MEGALVKGKTHEKTSVRDPVAPPPIPTPPQKTSKLQKILTSKYFRIPLLLMLLVFIFGASLFIAYWTGGRVQKPYSSQPLPIPTPSPTPTSTPEPTANWNTYVSQALRISFNYPATYSKPEERSGYLSILSPLNPDRGKSFDVQEGELKVEIYTDPAENNDSSEQCLKDHGLSDPIVTKQKNVSIAGISTIKYTLESAEFICVIYNDTRYAIVKYPVQTDRQNEYNQILSTFQFLDQTDSDTSVFNDARRKTNLEALRSALELYKADHNKYPASLDSLLPEYLATIPKDPATDEPYTYEVSQDKLDYTITTELEDGSLYEVSAP